MATLNSGQKGSEQSNPMHPVHPEARLPVDEEHGDLSYRTDASCSPRRSGWGFSDVDWRYVFAVQHWATLIWALIFLICLGITHWVQHVTSRPFLAYDASISYIAPDKDTVPSNAAWLVPFAVLFINLIILECFVNRRQNRNISQALAVSLHFLLDAICCFVCMRFIVEVTKLSAGRLRPDFLQDCYGLGGLSGSPQLSFADGSSAACTSQNADSRKSLPSGHSSSAMVTFAYSIIYCTWTCYFRPGETSLGSLHSRSGFRISLAARLWNELAHSSLVVWNVLQFTFAWATGITRFTDNKHNVSDIVAGWFIGAAIAFIFASRAIGLSKYLLLSNSA